MEYVAPHVEDCQAFEDGEETKEVQEEDAVEENATTTPAHMFTALTYLSSHKQNLSPEGRRKYDTSKKVMFESDVHNELLLTETANNE